MKNFNLKISKFIGVAIFLAIIFNVNNLFSQFIRNGNFDTIKFLKE